MTPGVMANVRVCGIAATKDAFPACDAVIEQVPAATRVIAPEASTEHMPVEFETYETGSPELAVAVSVAAVPVCATLAGCGNEMVFPLSMTVKLCVTEGAAAYLASPGCEAVIEHVPPEPNVTAPAGVTEQTDGEFDA